MALKFAACAAIAVGLAGTLTRADADPLLSVNVGAFPNDPSADTLQAAFGKINTAVNLIGTKVGGVFYPSFPPGSISLSGINGLANSVPCNATGAAGALLSCTTLPTNLTLPSAILSAPSFTGTATGVNQTLSGTLGITGLLTGVNETLSGTLGVTGTLNVTGLFTGGSQALTGVMQNTGGTFSVVNLYTSPPANGVFLGGAGAQFSKSDITGSISGDHDRAQTFLRMTSQADASVGETNLVLNTSVSTGLKVPWKINTAYTSGTFADANGNTYKETVASCTSAASGVGPSGLGSGIVDNTCHWDYANAAALSYRAGIYNGLYVTAGNGDTWAQANNMNLVSGSHMGFEVNTELDMTNNVGDFIPGGSQGAYDIIMVVNGAFPVTAYINGGAGTNSTWGAHYGLYFAGTNAIKDADLELDTSSTYGARFGGILPSVHSGAGLLEQSTTPVAAWYNGNYSNAAIQCSGSGIHQCLVDTSTGDGASINVAGSQTIASLYVTGTAPIGLQLSGTNATASLYVTSNPDFHYASTGTTCTNSDAIAVKINGVAKHLMVCP